MKAFKIKQQIKSVTFELKLLKYLKIYLIIHIMLIKSALENTRLTKIMNVKEYENQNYVVERILEKN